MYVSDLAWLAVHIAPSPKHQAMRHFPSVASTVSLSQELFKKQACRSGMWLVASLPHQEGTEDTAKYIAYRENNKCVGGVIDCGW